MKVNTAFQACMYFTIILLIFTLSVNFVSAANFFNTQTPTGVELNTSSANSTFLTLTGQTTTDLWLLVLVAAGAGGIVVAWLTHSTAILGVYLFSVIFWGSYGSMLGVTRIGNYIPVAFLFIATAALIFIWMGAIIGMLSGSG